MPGKTLPAWQDTVCMISYWCKYIQCLWQWQAGHWKNHQKAGKKL